jgi:hypothetical protein
MRGWVYEDLGHPFSVIEGNGQIEGLVELSKVPSIGLIKNLPHVAEFSDHLAELICSQPFCDFDRSHPSPGGAHKRARLPDDRLDRGIAGDAVLRRPPGRRRIGVDIPEARTPEPVGHDHIIGKNESLDLSQLRLRSDLDFNPEGLHDLVDP